MGKTRGSQGSSVLRGSQHENDDVAETEPRDDEQLDAVATDETDPQRRDSCKSILVPAEYCGRK